MRVLQLTSDWKWTGPAEPMLSLGRAIRGLGAQVDFAFPAPPVDADQSLAQNAHARGEESVLPLRRARGVRPLADRGELARLHEYFRSERPDIVHCWHTRDHVLALRARGRSSTPALVRSLRRWEPETPWPWNRWLVGRGCEGLLCVSPGSALRHRGVRGPGALLGRLGSVDLTRFAPGSAGVEDHETRDGLGLAPDAAVVGIVARMQTHRRFDLLLDAAALLFARMPRARLLIVGRGTQRRAVAEVPAARRGIADRVIFAGYRGADFVSVLRSCSVFTFLVPGSDGHCRALLEAQACGIPAVTTQRGALPEIVRDEESGLVVEEDSESLACAWQRLLQDEALRTRLARGARRRAEAHFAPDDHARDVLGFYDEVVSGASL